MRAIAKKVIVFTALVGLLVTAAYANGYKTKNAEKAAKTLEAERILDSLGYWITNVDGKGDDSTRQAIAAFQKVEGLKRTGVLTDDLLETMRSSFRPAPKYNGGSHIEIDISRQVMFLVGDDGFVSKILPVSTGSGERYEFEGKWEKAYTPRGTFKIERQIKGIRKAPLGTIYNPSYFYGGVAIHGSNSVPFTAASHGCARIPRFADKEFSDMITVGMRIYVYD
jgi:lipoprotein-anchoring transpeptidase ErfK/SrfK